MGRFKGKAYCSADQFANASPAYFEVTGAHGPTKTNKSDRIYYVIDGTGEYLVGDKKFAVASSDVVIVPKNTRYDYWATEGSVLKLFLVHTPAFDPEAEVLG